MGAKQHKTKRGFLTEGLKTKCHDASINDLGFRLAFGPKAKVFSEIGNFIGIGK